jgi:hypothetical protein
MCITKDTLILTKYGFLPVKDLINIPFVAIMNGSEYTCPNGFHFIGRQNVYRLHLSNGSSIKCTPKQKIGIVKKNTLQYLALGNLTREDIIIIPSNNQSSTQSSILRIDKLDIQDVYMCHIEPIQCFNANGIKLYCTDTIVF